MAKIRLSVRAKEDLLDIWSHIAADGNPEGVQVVRVLHGARRIDLAMFLAGVE